MFLNHIDESNKSMIDLVSLFLSTARIESGTLVVELGPTDLVTIADEVIMEFLPQINIKKLNIKSDYDENIPSISSDSRLMREVFQNILSNTIKYTPDEGNLMFLIKKQGSDLLVSLSDDGCGIPKEQQEKIFTKLFRADNAKDIDSTGTGLGLYLARSILDQLGGEMWFDSEEGKGTTFYIKFSKVLSRR